VWFSDNSLTLNLTKTNCVQFVSKSNTPMNININYGDAQINITRHLKFLGLILDSTLSWKEHIKQTAIKLSSASYAIGILTSVMSLEEHCFHTRQGIDLHYTTCKLAKVQCLTLESG
jgi:hypothetical protein